MSDAAFHAFAASAFEGRPPAAIDAETARHVARLVLDAESRRARIAAEAALLETEARDHLRAVARRFAPTLGAWVDQAAPAGRRSVKSPGGTIGRKQCAGGVVVVDQAAALAWIEAQSEPAAFGRWQRLPDERKLTEWATRTGEVPPGCKLLPPRDAVYVRQGDVYVNLTDEAAR